MKGLKEYYLIFPYQWVIKFLTCNGKYPLIKREFAFKIDDYWVKHKQFKNISDAQYFMSSYGYDQEPSLKVPIRFGYERAFRNYLIVSQPSSINVGPTDDKKCPIVLDVDLKDYGKTCCESSCDVCWVKYARVALVDVVNWLRDFMLFKNVLAVDSGSGGFHIYVLDERVWDWDQEAREQFYTFIPPSVILDKSIRVNYTHLVKIPFSPNFKNGCLSLPILNIHEYLPSQRIKLEDATLEIINKFLIL